MKHKKLFIATVAIFSVIIFFAVFLMIWFFGDKYKDFDGNFKKENEIPGLADGAVPQGLGNYTAAYETENGETATQQYFFVSAYMIDGSPSRIYVTGADTGYVGYVTVKNTDGSDYTGHCGGIATNGVTLWVTSDDTVFVAKSSSSEYKNIVGEIIAKAQSETDNTISFTSSFAANCNASFCFYYDNPDYTSITYDKLYVGEFYRAGNYETDKNHRLTTPNGYLNTAFVYEYSVSTAGEYGLTVLSDSSLDGTNKVPQIQKIISVPEKIQGFARAGGKMVLSESYGLANSHIYSFDWNSVTASTNRSSYKTVAGSNFAYSGVVKTTGVQYTVDNLYVYYADKTNSDLGVVDYSIPSMSEGLCANGNRVYVLFESAGKKYKTFVRQQLKNIYSFVPKNR